MCEREDELVNDAIDGDGAADELEVGVGRIVEDEVLSVEIRQRRSANTTGKLQGDVLSHWVMPHLDGRQLTVGTWLTYGSCTIVLIVCSTERSANS